MLRWIFTKLFLAFSFCFYAAVIRWSVNTPVRLSGHRISASPHWEDPLSFHLWSLQWRTQNLPQQCQEGNNHQNGPYLLIWMKMKYAYCFIAVCQIKGLISFLCQCKYRSCVYLTRQNKSFDLFCRVRHTAVSSVIPKMSNYSFNNCLLVYLLVHIGFVNVPLTTWADM